MVEGPGHPPSIGCSLCLVGTNYLHGTMCLSFMCHSPLHYFLHGVPHSSIRLGGKSLMACHSFHPANNCSKIAVNYPIPCMIVTAPPSRHEVLEWSICFASSFLCECEVFQWFPWEVLKYGCSELPWSSGCFLWNSSITSTAFFMNMMGPHEFSLAIVPSQCTKYCSWFLWKLESKISFFPFYIYSNLLCWGGYLCYMYVWML